MNTLYKYDHYFDQNERKKIIEELNSKYPDFFSYEVILKTLKDREVFAVTLNNKKTGKAEDKVAFYIDGNTHAGEVTGMMAAMYTMDALLCNYGKDEKVTFLLDNYAFYIIPCVSPDGSDTYLHSPYMLRSVDRDYEKDDKGLVAEDIDGDGVIRMMRFKTTYGRYKADGNLMIPRAADDVCGDFYDVYTEGSIKDYDGLDLEVARQAWSLDFNRNYPYGWFNDFRQHGAGPYPLSNPENKAIVDFVIAHPNISSVLTHHTSGGVLLTPPGTYNEKKAPYFDMAVYKTLGKLCEKTMGYKSVNIFDGFMSDQENYDSGAFDDWCYETKGVYATTLELWNLEKRVGYTDEWTKIPTLEEECEKFKKCYDWVKENCPQHYKDWEEFDHPVLGKVEIGGFNSKYTFQNPPADFLLQEVEKTFDFTLAYAALLPRIEIVSVNKTIISDGVYKVEAVIGNLGYLPTNITDKATMINIAKGIDVSVDCEVLNGEKKINIGELAGFSSTDTGCMYYGNISTLTSAAKKKKVCFICKTEKDTIELKVCGNRVNTIVKNI